MIDGDNVADTKVTGCSGRDVDGYKCRSDRGRSTASAASRAGDPPPKGKVTHLF